MDHLPTFLVVGAAKSGTTSLHYYLQQHPEVCVPPCKETFVFNERSVAGAWPAMDRYNETEYRQLFNEHTTEQTRAWGEVTTSNLYYHEEAVPQIKKLLGDPQIIILLRNPVERAWSNWTYTFASHGEKLGFEEALAEEPARVEQRINFMAHYVSLGFYFEAVKHFLEVFPRHKVYLHEDLKANTTGTVSEIFGFIGVDDGFEADYETIYNPSGIPRSRLLHRFLLRDKHTRGTLPQRAARMLLGPGRADRFFHTMRMKNLKRVPMNHETRRRLVETYREDVVQLQDLIGRDLAHWLET